MNKEVLVTFLTTKLLKEYTNYTITHLSLLLPIFFLYKLTLFQLFHNFYDFYKEISLKIHVLELGNFDDFNYENMRLKFRYTLLHIKNIKFLKCVF